MNKKKVSLRIAAGFLLAALSMAAGGTGAAILHSLTLENPLKTPDVEGGVEEELEEGKKVSFENKGEADVFLRVSWAETWEAADGTVLPNVAKSADGETVRPASPVWANREKWDQTSSDGWIYYKKVLPGTASGRADRNTGYLIEDVEFVSLNELPDQRYRDAEYSLHVVMEIVQASGEWEVSRDAAQKLFGKEIAHSGTWEGDGKYDCIITWKEPGTQG